MPARGPLTLPKMSHTLPEMGDLLSNNRRPPIGVTQGGSSRRYAGCKPAATRGIVNQRKSKTK